MPGVGEPPATARAARPLVGITGPDLGGRLARRLLAWLLRRAGAKVRCLRPAGCTDLEGLEGLLLAGGDDVAPARYGAAPRPGSRWDERRDALEWAALEFAASRGLPVLGICRGMQLLNVFLGGTLHQDLADAIPGVRHARTWLPLTPVRVAEDSRLAALVGTERLRVNSIHHQAVDRVAPLLDVTARDAVGFPEAVEARGGAFRMGVQWHPEFIFWDPRQRAIVGALVDAAKSAARDV